VGNICFKYAQSFSYVLFISRASYRFTPLLNLSSLILGLTPFGWLPSITLTPANSITYYGNIVFDLSLFDLRPLFQEKVTMA
jgi:hypothetical protein